MKKLLFAFLNLFLFLNSYTQERVTQIHEQVGYADIMHEYNETIYYLYNKSGCLYLNNYSKGKLEKIADNCNVGFGHFYKDKLFALNDEKIWMYNLVNGNQKEVQLPVEFIYYSILFYTNDKVILKATFRSGNYPKYFVFDFKKGIKELPGDYGTPLALEGDNVVFHSWSDDASRPQRFTLINIETKEKTILVNDSNLSSSFTFQRNKVWFYNGSYEATSYNIETKQFLSFSELRAGVSTNIHSFFEKDSLLILYAGTNLSYEITSYNLNQKKVIAKKSKSGSDTKSIKVGKFAFYEKYFIGLNYYSELVRYEYITGEISTYTTNINDLLLVDIESLIKKDKTIQFDEKQIMVIDLKNNVQTSYTYVPGNTYQNLYHYHSMIYDEDDDYIYAHFQELNPINLNQLRINKKMGEVKEFFIRNLVSGLKSIAMLLKVKDEIVLKSDNLYHIKGNRVNKINEMTLFNSNANPLDRIKTKSNGTIQYFCHYYGGYIVYEYDGCNNYPVDTIKNNPGGNYLNYFDGMYFYTKGWTTYALKKNKEIKLKTSSDTYPSILSYKEKIYMLINDSLYVVRQDKLDLISGVDPTTYDLYEDQEKLYLRGRKNYEIVNDKVIEIKNLNEYFRVISSDSEKQSLLVSTGSSIGYIKQSIYYPIFSDSSIFVNKVKSEILVRKNNKASLININSYKVTPLPNLENGMYRAITINDYDTLIYTIENFTTKANIYKLKNNKLDELVHSINNYSASGYGANWANIENEYLLRVSNLVISIDHYSRFNEISLRNSGNFLSAKDYIYFTAKDTEHDLQVFRYDVGDLIYEYPEKRSLDFKLFPSLANNYVEVKSPSRGVINENFIIYDVSGRKLASGLLTNERINIQNFSNGVYFMEINNDEGKQVLKFVKF